MEPTARPHGSIALRLSCAIALLASACGLAAQQYIFHAYRQAEGLENQAVRTLAADTHGFLWVGTENGVYRFLGSGFQRFGAAEGIAERDVEQVLASPDGTVWVGTPRNLYRWNGLRFVPAGPKPIHVWNAPNMAVEASGNSLLVMDRGALHRLRFAPGGSFVDYAPFFPEQTRAAYPVLKSLNSVNAMQDGSLWMGCRRTLCSWQRGSLQGGSLGAGSLVEWAETRGVPQDFYSFALTDARGSVWAVGDHHVLELPRGASRFIDRSPPQFAKGAVYPRTPIAADPQGRILVSAGGGIARWDGSRWQTIGPANGLISTHLTALLFDASGDLWAGSTGHGLAHWAGYNNWQGWTERQGLPSANIWAIGALADGRVVAGTEKGPAIVDPATGAVTALAASAGWKYGQISAAIPDDQSPRPTMLLTTAEGAILRLDARTGVLTRLIDVHSYIYQMYAAGGRRFVLTPNGFSEATNLSAGARARPALAPVPQMADLLGAGHPINSGCSARSGAAWFLASNGLVALRNNQWTRVDIEGLPANVSQLQDLACSADGSFWVNIGDDAIWHLVPSAAQVGPAEAGPASLGAGPAPAQSQAQAAPVRLHATELTLPAQLRDMNVVGKMGDRRGWLWLATDSGLLVWNGISWRHLTQEDGLLWNDVNGNRLSILADGSVWIGTSGGLARLLHPESIFARPPPTVAMIETRRGSQILPLAGAYRLPWSRQDLSFQFAVPDKSNRADLRFRYRMTGLDDDWIETPNQTVNFESLPPGGYVFEILAQDSTGAAPSDTVSVEVRIDPPWWRTLWFFSLLALVAAAGTVLLIRLRDRRLVERKRVLEELVAQRTAELETSREDLRRQATHDALTGLLNRPAILAALEKDLSRAQREAGTVTLIFADIDHFKQINDTYGHLAGDEALRRFAAAVAGNIRPYDSAGRYGGEEFLMVSNGMTAKSVEGRLAALHQALTGIRVRHGDSEFVMGCSLGAVQIEHGQIVSQKDALAAADAALYEAKRLGRARFVLGKLATATSLEQGADKGYTSAV